MKRVKFGDVHFMGEHDHTLCGQMAFGNEKEIHIGDSFR